MTWLNILGELATNVIKSILDFLQLNWNSFTVSFLLLSIAMVVSFLPSALCNSTYREGSKFERGILKVLFNIPPFGIVTKIKSKLHTWAKTKKKESFRFENNIIRNFFSKKVRQLVYLLAEYAFILIIGVAFFALLHILLPDVFNQVKELVALNNDKQALIFNTDLLCNTIKMIFIPKSINGIIFIIFAVLSSLPIVAGMFYEPYKVTFTDKEFPEFPRFCEAFAKKWCEQIKCLGVIITIFEFPGFIEKWLARFGLFDLSTKFPGFSFQNFSLIDFFGQFEVYLIILFVVELLASLIFLLPLIIGFGVRTYHKNKKTYTIHSASPARNRLVYRRKSIRDYNLKQWISYISLIICILFYGGFAIKLYVDADFRNELLTQLIESTNQQLESFSFINLGSLLVIVIVMILAMLLSTTSARLSLVATYICSGLVLFIVCPAMVNSVNEKIASGTNANEAIASVFALFLTSFIVLCTNGLIGYFSRKFNTKLYSGKNFIKMVNLTLIVSMTWGYLGAVIAFILFNVVTTYFNLTMLCYDLAFIAIIICLSYEVHNIKKTEHLTAGQTIVTAIDYTTD